MLHWLLLAWSGLMPGSTPQKKPFQDPVSVTLRALPVPPMAFPALEASTGSAAPVMPKPKPAPVKTGKPPVSAKSAQQTLPPAPAATATAASTDAAILSPPGQTLSDRKSAVPADGPPPSDAQTLSHGSSEETVAEASASVAIFAPSQHEPPASSRVRRIVTPPPADLKYDVQALREGQNVYGSGRIVWQPAGNRYQINGEAGVLFFNVLEFRSEGVLDDGGVAPALYSEKRFRKPLTSTHFHREQGLIRFSASASSYPHRGGEQDRASIVWQLASIGRGDPQAFHPNAGIELFVAGVRNGETWHVRVVGEEDIEVEAGRMRTWHVVREPRAGSYDQKLDIWFAPQQEWYPVRLRYTESNGDWLDMSLSSIRGVAAR